MSLDDILRYEMKENTTLIEPSSLVKVSAALTKNLFVAGLINTVLSFLTFHNSHTRQSGLWNVSSSLIAHLSFHHVFVPGQVLVLRSNSNGCSR